MRALSKAVLRDGARGLHNHLGTMHDRVVCVVASVSAVAMPAVIAVAALFAVAVTVAVAAAMAAGSELIG